jgi:hypothetical protein
MPTHNNLYAGFPLFIHIRMLFLYLKEDTTFDFGDTNTKKSVFTMTETLCRRHQGAIKEKKCQ